MHNEEERRVSQTDVLPLFTVRLNRSSCYEKPRLSSDVLQVRGDENGNNPGQSGDNGGGAVPPPNPNRPVFRADPTLKSCFNTLPLDGRDDLKRLFLVG